MLVIKIGHPASWTANTVLSALIAIAMSVMFSLVALAIIKVNFLGEGVDDVPFWAAYSFLIGMCLFIVRCRAEAWDLIGRLREHMREDNPSNPAVH